MPNVYDMRKLILEEAHDSRYSIHQGSTKMYHDIKEVFWSDGFNGDIEEFFTKCLNCQ